MARPKRKPTSAKHLGTKRRGPITSGELHRWLTEPDSARALDEAVAARLEDARLATMGERDFPIGRWASKVAKLLDTVAIHPDNPWTRSAVDVLAQIDIVKWFHAQFRTYYPRNNVPAATPHVFAFEQDVSVPVKFNSTFTVPANSQCTVELVCLTDTTAVGPRNGKWNTHVCYAESTTALNIPSIDVSIFPE